MTCQFAHLDGAYVLGSLAPAERLAFEAHLPGCAECSRGVRELAGLPGLLTQVDVADLEVRTPDAPLPPTLLPALVREVRGEQRRRSVLTAVLAAAVAAVFVSALAIGGAFDRSTSTTAAPAPTPTASRTVAPAGQAMQPVDGRTGSAQVAVALTGVAWGTKVDLTCSYPTGPGGRETSGPGASSAYALVVHTRAGREEQVATWKALPGKTMRLTGATATGRTDITTVEVRSSEGKVLFTLPV